MILLSPVAPPLFSLLPLSLISLHFFFLDLITSRWVSLHLALYMHLWDWSGSVSGYARSSLAILSIFCFVYRTSIDFYIRR